MIDVVNGVIDFNKIEVADVVDLKMLKSFLDNFALSMNCATVAVDHEGKEITAPSCYRDFCENHIHKSPIGDDRCAECHKRMGQEAVKLNRPYVGQCHAGLIDFAAPIIINGNHIGTVLGGQILDTKPNEDLIRQGATEMNIDPDSLWSATQNIDIVPRSNIEAAAEVLYIVVNQLAMNGYRQLEMKTMSESLVDSFEQISQTVEVLAESAQSITTDQYELTENIKGVEETVGKISTVLKSIEAIANNTKLIGLNASIEAARLGETGRGFSVVAKEIQNLSGKSKETTIEINKMNQTITENIEETIVKANNTLQTTEGQSSAMEELSATIQNLTELTERMKALF